MHEMGVALTKAASASLKTLEGLKAKSKMPSQKAQAAIDMHIDALEQIFNDMWQSPLSYLDNTPDEVVTQRRSNLDDRESSLVDHNVQEASDKDCDSGQNPNFLRNPTHCDTCGATYDKVDHSECPSCCEAKMDEWVNKLRSLKKDR
jgi:predicted Zn-ribbon and HTH transcriptional regulator